MTTNIILNFHTEVFYKSWAAKALRCFCHGAPCGQ